MIQPIQIRFHHVRPDSNVAAEIERFASKLERIYDRITSCHVVISRPHRHHAAGNHFHVRIELGVPRATLVATHEPTVRPVLQQPDLPAVHKQVDVAAERKVLRLAVHDAFDAMTRQLREFARRRHGAVKAHEPKAPLPVAAPAVLRRSTR